MYGLEGIFLYNRGDVVFRIQNTTIIKYSLPCCWEKEMNSLLLLQSISGQRFNFYPQTFFTDLVPHGMSSWLTLLDFHCKIFVKCIGLGKNLQVAFIKLQNFMPSS